MDILAGLEPQLAIPVVVVVLGALLVYVFGFQKTTEPSYEHLAVLQSSSSYKNRSVTISSKQKSTSSSSNGTKPKANGHVVSDKEKNGVIKKVAKAEVNKENVKPAQVKVQVKKEKAKVPATKDKPADFESGDWIQATSRKDKKKTTKKEEIPATVSSPAPAYRSYQNQAPSSPKKGRAGSPTKATIIFEDDSEDKTIVLKEMELFQKQNHSTQTSPVKKDVKSVSVSPSKESSVESTPKKAAPKAAEVVAEEKKVLKEIAAPEVKKAEAKEKVKEAKAKSNVAFDEMGDTWEEAKSRGAKKRTRKD